MGRKRAALSCIFLQNIKQNTKAFVLREKAVLLMPLFAVLHLLTLNPNWTPTWDSAIYITLGRSLINLDGFRYMGYSHTTYPPLFPLLLSPIIGIFGYSFLLMRLLIVGAALCSVWVTYTLVRDLYGDRFLATLVMFLTATSHVLLFECTRILSDIPYLFFSLLALMFGERYAVYARGHIYRNAFLVILFLLLSYFTRNMGLMLFAGIATYLVLGGYRLRVSASNLKKAAIVGIVFGIFVTVWTIRNISVDERMPSELREAIDYKKAFVRVNPNDPYSKTIRFSDLIARASRNIGYYIWLLGNVVVNRLMYFQHVGKIISMIFLAGFVYCIVKKRTSIEYYVFFYLLCILVWPETQGARFLLPVLPFIFYYILRGGELLLKGFIALLKEHLFSERNQEVFLKVSLIMMAIIWVYGSVTWNTWIIRNEHTKPYYRGDMADFLDVIDWVRNNTSPETVIVCDRAPYVYLLAERKAFSFPRVDAPQKIMLSIEQSGAHYVIYSPVGGFAARYLSPAIYANSDRFSEIRRQGKSIIYEVQR